MTAVDGSVPDPGRLRAPGEPDGAVDRSDLHLLPRPSLPAEPTDAPRAPKRRRMHGPSGREEVL